MTSAHEVLEALYPKIVDVLPERQVLNGWDRDTELGFRTVVVGFAPTPGTAAMTTALASDEGGYGSVETITIRCTAAVWDGDSEFTLKEDQVDIDIGVIRELLAVESKSGNRLGGIIFRANLASAAQWYREVEVRDGGTFYTAQCDFAIEAQVHGA
jgi:hypothetical protein